jgi:signal transduction histidine kinase/ActR/RegA family two-component response regulator
MTLPRFLRRSIRLKITALVVASTFAALLLSAIGLSWYTVRDYGTRKVNDVRTQAAIVARAAAPALSFNDPEEARRDLETLRARPDVEQVALYGADGRLFTSYSRAGDGVAARAGAWAPGHHVQGDYITVVYPIVEDGEVLGTLVLKAHYEVNGRLIAFVLILGAVMAFALIAAVVFSSWLQRAITDPILSLAQAAGSVVERRDFSVRTGRMTDDEIGDLGEAINRMLADLGREIGERRNAEEGLRRADRHKDEFLATLAHELRNPLAAIRTALQVMHMKADDREAQAASRAVIDRQAAQLVRLIDDLMDVSRITTGKLSLRPERVELRRVALAAIESIQPSVQKNGHRLGIQLPPPDVVIHADPARLEQVFLNLLNNAVKFTKSGGTIDFSLEVVDGEMVARVRDSGIGVPADMLESIFDMFTQVDRRLDRPAAGLGVGLSISRFLVELHGGTLRASSAGPDRGTEFTVRLPAQVVQTEAPAAPSDATPPPGRFRILVVDDNADFADSLGLMLRTLGHDVRVEHDGLAGLAAADVFRPDIAMLDIGMPHLDGYELARRLRARPATASCRLVAITGWGQPADRQRSSEAGFDEHIVKPLELDRLRRLLVLLTRGLSPTPTEEKSTTSR